MHGLVSHEVQIKLLYASKSNQLGRAPADGVNEYSIISHRCRSIIVGHDLCAASDRSCCLSKRFSLFEARIRKHWIVLWCITFASLFGSIQDPSLSLQTPCIAIAISLNVMCKLQLPLYRLHVMYNYFYYVMYNYLYTAYDYTKCIITSIHIMYN